MSEKTVPYTTAIAMLHAGEWADQVARGERGDGEFELRRFGNEIGLVAFSDEDEYNEDGDEIRVARLEAYEKFPTVEEARSFVDGLIARRD